jgi:hypothetical protein
MGKQGINFPLFDDLTEKDRRMPIIPFNPLALTFDLSASGSLRCK